MAWSRYPPRRRATVGRDRGLPRARRAGSRSRAPDPSARIVTVAAVAALLLGIIIYVATDKGRIKIEVNDPNAVVLVDGKEVRIEGLGDPITLSIG